MAAAIKSSLLTITLLLVALAANIQMATASGPTPRGLSSLSVRAHRLWCPEHPPVLRAPGAAPPFKVSTVTASAAPLTSFSVFPPHASSPKLLVALIKDGMKQHPRNKNEKKISFLASF
ncbi:uncharacterized protein A4U43_C08F3900 [Asparagus officinalis]|uniref:uncharacterized protein LOC109822936 n=1 Tax=Asparagus officinalis TaxID=4686 RepID=UPI00098E3B91|nr:uncharacterized protein LOC109822936 [Asparagus officinalis]ONK59189.1 uncharacterized protein A4U43_C08F3900 [Asparagus officinalis]